MTLLIRESPAEFTGPETGVAGYLAPGLAILSASLVGRYRPRHSDVRDAGKVSIVARVPYFL
jgi:hypothetical protein